VSVQQARSELSTRKLLEASATLIAERGYERTTLADIGERAGYSQGLVTRRFGSKGNLLVALIERLSERFGPERLGDTVGERRGLDAVLHVLHEIRDDAQRSPADLRGFYALMFEAVKPVPELQERLRELHRAFRRRIAGFVADGVADGSVRADADPAATANLVVAALRGVAFLWMLDPDDVPVVAELDALAGQLTRLLAP
jgi:AcrR family transcriptional regulator